MTFDSFSVSRLRLQCSGILFLGCKVKKVLSLSSTKSQLTVGRRRYIVKALQTNRVGKLRKVFADGM